MRQEIYELRGYYEDNAEEFDSLIEEYKLIYLSLSKQALMQLALIRVVEVTNGIIQYSYRLGEDDALSVEQTRECMKFSLGCIRNQEINGVKIDAQLGAIMKDVRELYIKGFKQGDDNAMKHFYAHSTAIFEAVGRKRLLDAHKFAKNNLTQLYTKKFIDSMIGYAFRYVDD